MQRIPKTAARRVQRVSLIWGGIEYSESRVWAGTKHQLIVKLISDQWIQNEDRHSRIACS